MFNILHYLNSLSPKVKGGFFKALEEKTPLALHLQLKALQRAQLNQMKKKILIRSARQSELKKRKLNKKNMYTHKALV